MAHSVKITSQPSHLAYDASVYMAACLDCGWRGFWRTDWFDADEDAQAHATTDDDYEPAVIWPDGDYRETREVL